MTITEWSALAAVGAALCGIGGFVWGRAYGAGRLRAEINQDRANIGSLTSVLEALAKNFSECQKRGAECAATTRVWLEASSHRLTELQGDFAAHKAAVHQHHESQAIHTTDEWRKNVMERFDRIEANVNRHLDEQTKLLVARIESVERTVRNGGDK